MLPQLLPHAAAVYMETGLYVPSGCLFWFNHLEMLRVKFSVGLHDKWDSLFHWFKQKEKVRAKLPVGLHDQ